MKKVLISLCAAAAVLHAAAEGYQVNNMSARQAGMGHAGTAMQLDAESIFFNPAATALQRSRFDFSAGMTGIFSDCTFRSLPTVENGYTPGPAERSSNFATPLHLYFNYKPTDRLAVGVGFYTPDGSSIDWGDSWSGAHLVQQISLQAFTVQPTLSFRITDRLSVGAGLTITWGNFDLSRSMLPVGRGNQTLVGGFTQLGGLLGAAGGQLGLSPEQIAAYQAQAQAGADYFANNLLQSPIVSATLRGSARVAVGVNAGLLYRITDAWTVGMTWRSRVDMRVDTGRATLAYGSTEAQQHLAFLNAAMAMAGREAVIPALDQGTFRAQLPLPTSVTWGVSFRPTPKWEIAADLQWVGWSAYRALSVQFSEPDLEIYSVKNYANTLAFRIGGEYRVCDLLTARVGMYADQSPVSSEYLNPETPSMTKLSYTAGLTLRPAKCLSIDLAYCYVSAADPERTGSYPIYSYASDGTATVDEVFSGNYRLHANIFSIGLGLHF